MATNMATRKTQKNQKNPKAASRSLSWVRRRSAKCDWLADRRGQGGRTTSKGPGPVTRGKVVSWTPKTFSLFAFFFAAREDQPVLLRSRAICRLSRIFSEIPQDRHRPPSDLADGLMRNSSSGQNASLDKRIGMFATAGHELGKLANNSPRPCQLDRLDPGSCKSATSKLALRVTMLQHPARPFSTPFSTPLK
jgi:hypothetical protein